MVSDPQGLTPPGQSEHEIAPFAGNEQPTSIAAGPRGEGVAARAAISGEIAVTNVTLCVRTLSAAVTLNLFVACAEAKSYRELFPDRTYDNQKAQQLVESLNYQDGAVNLGAGGVKLNLPGGIYFLSGMEQLDEIKSVIPAVMAMPQFEEGSRYQDYVPGVDKVAAYGIGGLIAGKILAKAGILAIALVFLKKGWILAVLALAGLWRFGARFLRRTPA